MFVLIAISCSANDTLIIQAKISVNTEQERLLQILHIDVKLRFTTVIIWASDYMNGFSVKSCEADFR